jgi:NADH:ubiquinone oxidoreductase subunit F (NADH-binding)
MTVDQREETLRRLQASGLRGRGGASYEAWRKWRAVLAEDGIPFAVANGGESEPGSIKDRFIMRTRPKDVLTGLRIAMDTLGAERGYVYLKGSFHEEEKRLRAALQAMDGGPGISIHLGDDTYVGGEETAVLESIEGRVAWPRPKPPRPSAVGLFGRPTLVQNVDTLARVEDAVRAAEAFGEQDTITVTLWGDVRSPGAHVVPVGRTLRSVIEREGGGATAGIGMVFPNGAQSMPLSAAQLDVALHPTSLGALGSGLGTASILVLDEAAAPHSIVASIARFFERESCGQCPPCALGAENLRRLVTGDRPPTIRLAPHAALRETASFMAMHGYCSHAKAGAAAVTKLFALWPDEIMSHLQSGSAPAGGRERDPFAPGSSERRALDAFLESI